MQIIKNHLKIQIMTKFELIKANRTLLQALVDNKIDPAEVRNIDIYEEYKQMKAQKLKVGYIVSFLMEKYALKERAVYYIIKRMAIKVKL